MILFFYVQPPQSPTRGLLLPSPVGKGWGWGFFYSLTNFFVTIPLSVCIFIKYTPDARFSTLID